MTIGDGSPANKLQIEDPSEAMDVDCSETDPCKFVETDVFENADTSNGDIEDDDVYDSVEELTSDDDDDDDYLLSSESDDEDESIRPDNDEKSSRPPR